MSKLLALFCVLATVYGAKGENRIEDIDIKEVPYQASIKVYNENTKKFEHQCGGSIIARKWIMSAAHCAKGLDENNSVVGVGNTNVDEMQIFKISKILIHPQYHELSVPHFNYDIALFRGGAPLFLTRDKTQYGIVSWGSPGVCTRIASPKIRKWIKMKSGA